MSAKVKSKGRGTDEDTRATQGEEEDGTTKTYRRLLYQSYLLLEILESHLGFLTLHSPLPTSQNSTSPDHSTSQKTLSLRNLTKRTRKRTSRLARKWRLNLENFSGTQKIAKTVTPQELESLLREIDAILDADKEVIAWLEK